MERTRRPDIDWLRVGATYLLFVFHVGKVFDPAPFYHVRNADLSFAMPVMQRFGVPATARASMAFYNTRAELETLAAAIEEAREIFA